MKPLHAAFALLLCALGSALAQNGQRQVIQFQESPIQSSDPEQVRGRLSAAEDPPAYDVKKESFEILVPAAYDQKTPHGLFIWISAGDSTNIPKEWEAILAERKIIFVSARNSGNNRNIFDRMRMAIDANDNLRKLYAIDGRRVYVSGFSGGSRVASMLGVAWGEMFSGVVCFMGVNFYQDVVDAEGTKYGLNYIPVDEILELSKRYCRYALVTGEKDFNLNNTRAAFTDGFQKEGFAHAKLIEVPGVTHQLPPAERLAEALDFLDEGKLK